MFDLEGLWVVRFTASLTGAGVVVLETQRLFGGDSGYYWYGDYRTDGGQIVARATIVRHTVIPNAGTIFGDDADRFDITLTGTIGDGRIEALMARMDAGSNRSGHS